MLDHYIPDNKAFRKLRFARCLIENGKISLPTYQYRHFLDLPKMGAKKSSKSFQTYCLYAAVIGGGY